MVSVCGSVCKTKSGQDFPISLSIIWNQWKTRKMSDEDCERDLVRCRDRGAPAALASLDQIRKRQKSLDVAGEVFRVQSLLLEANTPFHDHTDIDRWMKQFGASTYGVQARFKMLVLVGDTLQGKTSKGMSLFGPSKTLKLACGPCPEGVLPSLGTLDREVVKAILFDEIRVDQVLTFRELFQANQYVQQLGTSACNPYAYTVWVYHIAMILCTNAFRLDDPKLSEGDRKWLRGNTVIVQIPDGDTWYMRPGEQRKHYPSKYVS